MAGCLIVGTLRMHRRRSGRERLRRRPATLVVDASNFALVMLALRYIGGLLSWSFIEPIRLIAFAALGLAPLAVLFALLDLRLARGDMAGLLVDLQSDPTTDLQAPLARALRDPSLPLFYWLPDFETWAAQEGTPPPEPTSSVERGARVLSRDGEPMAALTFDAALDEEHELLDAVVATTSIALEKRPPPGRAPGPAQRAPGVPGPGARGGPAGAAAARAGPPRGRPGSARGAVDGAGHARRRPGDGPGAPNPSAAG